jgi:beta-lactamase regulating signal transducer with metallopeptidase domain
MSTLWIEAALRSLLLAVAVWAVLRLLRVRNVLAEKAAWTVVLAAAIVMPLVLILASRWPELPKPSLTLPATVVPTSAHAVSLVTRQSTPVLPSAAQPDFRQSMQRPVNTSSDASRGIAPPQLPRSVYLTELTRPAALARRLPLTTWAIIVYLLVAAALLFRLLFGLAVSLRLWREAEPVTAPLPCAEGLRLRASSQIGAPVTVGSGVLLPAEYSGWSEEKLRIVLAHERSHVRHGDFYLQLLASLYAALVWLSPLGWWLKRKLSDLSEAIGDRSGLEQAASRTSYARVLLEFAAAPRPTLIGVAMARPSSLSRRMERLLNDSAFRRAFAGGRRTLLAALLAPAVLFAGAALVRVQAASIDSQRPASASAPLVVAQPAAPAAPVQETMTLRAENASGETLIAMAGGGGRAIVESDSSQIEAAFDRTLSVSGKLDLHVATGSGNIHLRRGSGSQVIVHGVIRSNHPEEADQVRALAANPPIEQDGNTIRIGVQHEDREQQRHISIDYEIEAPADAALQAASGSGNVTDEGVGQGAKLETGSGNIVATGLEGGYKAETGSGNISIEGTGDGDVRAETGSGNIEVKGVNGALQAETGSGDIKVAGKPSSAWKLQTGSGSIDFSAGDAPLTLDASTGSGSVTSDRPMALQTSSNGHHMRAQLNGGGPEVRIETGSGDVHIHE